MHRWRVVITTINGDEVRWRKSGAMHTLSPELGQLWVGNFKPALFQVMPDGHIVPRDSDPKAIDIARVALEPDAIRITSDDT